MSNNSSSTSHLGNILQARNNSLGLNLPARQAFRVPSNLRSEVVIIPSTSAPSWGSYFIFDVKERNCIISDLVLNFNVGTINGLTGSATNYPNYIPASLWTTKIELVINNITVDTLYPVSSNCVGGQAIPSFLALNYLNQLYSKSSYTSESSVGANIARTVVDNSANVYGWSFISNICEALENGLLLGHRKFLGNEQLQITFTGSLAANIQIDVWTF